MLIPFFQKPTDRKKKRGKKEKEKEEEMSRYLCYEKFSRKKNEKLFLGLRHYKYMFRLM